MQSSTNTQCSINCSILGGVKTATKARANHDSQLEGWIWEHFNDVVDLKKAGKTTCTGHDFQIVFDNI